MSVADVQKLLLQAETAIAGGDNAAAIRILLNASDAYRQMAASAGTSPATARALTSLSATCRARAAALGDVPNAAQSADTGIALYEMASSRWPEPLGVGTRFQKKPDMDRFREDIKATFARANPYEFILIENTDPGAAVDAVKVDFADDKPRRSGSVQKNHRDAVAWQPSAQPTDGLNTAIVTLRDNLARIRHAISTVQPAPVQKPAPPPAASMEGSFLLLDPQSIPNASATTKSTDSSSRSMKPDTLQPQQRPVDRTIQKTEAAPTSMMPPPTPVKLDTSSHSASRTLQRSAHESASQPSSPHHRNPSRSDPMLSDPANLRSEFEKLARVVLSLRQENESLRRSVTSSLDQISAALGVFERQVVDEAKRIQQHSDALARREAEVKRRENHANLTLQDLQVSLAAIMAENHATASGKLSPSQQELEALRVENHRLRLELQHRSHGHHGHQGGQHGKGH